MSFTATGRGLALVSRSPGQLFPDAPADGDPRHAWAPHRFVGHFDTCMLLRQLMTEDGNSAQLRSVLSAHSNLCIYRMADEEVIQAVADLLRCGRLALLERVPKPGDTIWFRMPGRQPRQEEPSPLLAQTPSRLSGRANVAEEPLAPPTMHWIEVELVGEDDRPIPWEPYLVELPNGHRLTGKLDGHGFTRIEGISMGGLCKITFPKLDQDAWDYVAALPALLTGQTAQEQAPALA